MRVIFVAQDPGGCDSLLPIIKEVSGRSGDESLCLMGGKSRDLLKKENIPYVDVEVHSRDEVLNIADKFNADVIVAGTSFGLSVDKLLIDFAKSTKSIKTVSIVDYWSNYWHRFKDRDSGKEYMPDFILVIDDFMKDEMVREGFDESRIRVTGNPHFDKFSENPVRTRRPEENTVLFISQPFTELSNQQLDLGYDEMQVLADLVSVLIGINNADGEKLALTIRPHPKEDPAKFHNLVQKFGNDIRIEIDAHSELPTALSRCRLVIGMSSIVLFEAALMRKATISYQPNVRNDFSILNRLDISKTVKTKTELHERIRSSLMSISGNSGGSQGMMDERLIDSYIKNNSTAKAVKFITELAKYKRLT